jgi:phage baseplate assembly protein W
MIVLTPKGQRVMRPGLACHVHEPIFAPNDGATAGLAARVTSRRRSAWEPRIRSWT